MVSGTPKHVAVIMDGNGRWAQQRGLPRLAGHEAGSKAIERCVQACLDTGWNISRSTHFRPRTGSVLP